MASRSEEMAYRIVDDLRRKPPQVRKDVVHDILHNGVFCPICGDDLPQDRPPTCSCKNKG